VHELPSEVGPGNLLSAVVESEHVTEVFTGFGEKALRAETVAENVADGVAAYLASGVPVGPHLADQLLLPISMAGSGSFRTSGLTPHAQTQLELLQEISGTKFAISRQENALTISV
jgi:RNA 3'-terminal phosphate cyclase (ATP)